MPSLLLPPSLHRRAAQDHRRELENGETDANPFAAAPYQPPQQQQNNPFA